MDIQFLGTSSGVPTRQRNVTALALQPENSKQWYLVDCGEATQHQLLRTPFSMQNLKAIFITHVHGDHSYGLPGLLASAAMAARKHPLILIGPHALDGWIKLTREMSQLYLPYELQFLAVEDLAAWQDERVQVGITLLSHRVPSYAYTFTDRQHEAALDTEKLAQEGVPKGELWGRLKKGENVAFAGRTLHAPDYLHYPHPPRRIVIGGDNDQPQLLRQACAGAQVLVHEATYTEDVAAKVGPGVQHSTAATVAAFAQDAALPNLLLTHFSPRYQHHSAESPSIEDIRREAAAQYHGQLWLAQDFARYRLSKNGQFALLAATA
jgi:ribonuclease Z